MTVDPHLVAIAQAATAFAETMRTAAAAGKRVCVRFEVRHPQRTKVINGVTKTWQNYDASYVRGAISFTGATDETIRDDDDDEPV